MSNLALVDGMMLAFWSPGPAEMLVLAVVALLLYGGNLPEVARSWGKSFAEFRRGLTGFQNELNEVIYSEPDQIAYHGEPGRDDSRYADGYEDADKDYQVDSADLDASAELDVPAELDASDQTVRDAGADTILEIPGSADEDEKLTND